MALSIRGRAMRNVALVVVVLHTVTALWVWRNWGEFERGTVLVWMDLPISFTYLHLPDPRFLACTLLLGGVQWAVLAALFTYLLGRSARRS